MPFDFLKHQARHMIDRLSKVYGIDLLYFFSGGFWLSLSHVCAVLLGFILTVCFTRFTGKEFYGQYQFILSVIYSLMFFTLPVMGSVIAQSVARGFDSSFVRGTKFRLKCSILGSIALVLVALWFIYVSPRSFWPVFVLAAVFFPVFALDGFSGFLIGKKRFDLASKYSLLFHFVLTIPMIAAVVLTKNLFVIFLCFFGATALMNILFYFKARGMVKSKKEEAGFLHYGLHLSLIEVLTIIAAQFDKLILSYFMGLENLAIYVVAMAFPEQLKGLMRLSINLLLPKFSTRRVLYDQRKILYAFIISGLFAVVGFLLVPFLLPLFFSEAYAGSVWFSQVLFISTVFVLPGFIFFTALQAKKRVSELYRYNTAYSVFSIVLLLFLVPKFGILGAILSRVVTTVFSTFYLWWLNRGS